MRAAGLIGVLVALSLWVGTAAAATVAEAVDGAAFRGYFVEPGADGDVNALEGLVARANADERWYFISLATEPSAGNDAFAESVQQRLPEPGTVLVVSPREIGAVSADYDDEPINSAVEAAARDFDAGFEVGATTFFEDLSGRPTGSGDGGGGGGGGGGGLAVLLVPLIAILGGLGILAWWSRRKAGARDGDRLAEARKEISAQLDALADRVVEHSDAAGLSDDRRVKEHYRAATAAYEGVRDALPRAGSLTVLATLSDRMDEARWRMESVDALLAAREPPPKPVAAEQARCFFDPTHPAGTEDATITTAAGDRQVKVCASCADKLRRGERPAPREIEVDGRRVPAGMAPRSYGGMGMGGLGPFSILLGGLMQGMSFDWGAPVRRPRSRGGPFGPDITPPGRFGSGRFGPGGFGSGGLGRGSGGGRPSIGRARRRR